MSSAVPGSDISRMGAILREFGEPFAHALAVFVREVALEQPGPSVNREGGSVLGELQSFDELDPALRQRLTEVIEEEDRQREDAHPSGREFTEDTPAEFAASRLRRVAEQRGITQKAIAEKIGVTPAAINRVFQHPDRSKVTTLRRIADALGVELYEIIS